MIDYNKYDLLQTNILGAIIIWPVEIDTAAEIINPTDFMRPMYQDIYSFILERKGADYVLLAEKFKKKYPVADIVGWGEDLHTSAYLKKHCLELKEINRKIAIHDTMLKVRSSFEDMTSAEMLEELHSKLSLIEATRTVDPVQAKILAMDADKRLENRFENRGKLTGIPYGLPELDKVTDGLHRGDLVIIAGRPSMGKSAFAQNVAEHGCSSGYAYLLFSLEMGKDQITDRMIASMGYISFSRIRSGNLSDSDFPQISKATGELNSFNFAIDDTPGVSLHEIRSKSRKMKRQSGLDVVIIDYLQLMKMAKDNRVQAIGEVSRGLKQLARELDITVIALSQLNRAVDSRPDKRPTMSDLRDSGEIEQDADVILFPFRPAAYCDKCRDRKNDSEHDSERHQRLAEIIIEKQRNGERNISIPMVWHGRYQRFESREAL